jgi:predicted metal-binding membrane protein
VPDESLRRHAFAGVSALLFVGSAAVTVAWCRSMAEMGEVAMPGGWTLSMAWMPMCGQTWTATAASFVGMWAVMMVAMMLPSLAPLLWRHRPMAGAAAAAAGAGYFFVWTALGAMIFALGAAFAEAAMRVPSLARAVPLTLALVVLLAGVFQFSTCKARHVAQCRPASRQHAAIPNGPLAAWRYGLRLGLHCSIACAGFTAILLVIGVMDLRAMAVVAAAITAERLAPHGERVAWAIGGVSIMTGVCLMGQAAWR